MKRWGNNAVVGYNELDEMLFLLDELTIARWHTSYGHTEYAWQNA